MRKELLLISVLLFVCTAIFAQGDFKLSEQMFSRINQNPAAIGNNEKLQIFTAGRLQYVGLGLEQSPTSALLMLMRTLLQRERPHCRFNPESW